MHYGELVAAQTREEALVADAVAKALGHDLEEGVAGGVAWLLSSLLPVAAAGAFIGLLLGLATVRGGRYARDGGWGGFGGGGWGGGVGGGGGWSGGGGMSGGGGASGSW